MEATVIMAAESWPVLAGGTYVQDEQQPVAPAVCPKCQSVHFNKNGSFRRKDGTRVQRYLCKSCHETFSLYTGTPLAYLKKRDRLQAFAESMGSGFPLRRHAAELGIHLSTAFRWRHLCLSSAAAEPQPKLSGQVAIGETQIAYSQKGRPRLPLFRRFSAGRASAILVVAGDGGHRLEIAGAGRLTPAALQPCLESVLAPQTEVCTTGAPVVAAACQSVGLVHLDLARLPKEEPAGMRLLMQMMNSMRAGLHGWLMRFRGVATRYLNHYLSWYRSLCQPRNEVALN